MRVTIRVQPRIERSVDPRDSIPRFEPLPTGRSPFRLSFVASVAIHLAGAVIAPPALAFLDQWSKPIVDLSKATMVPRDAMPLLVRLPDEPLLVRFPKMRKLPAPKLRTIRAKSRPRPAAPAPARETATASLPPRIGQPPVPTAILLQPSLKPVEIAEVPDLRSMAVWTGRSPQNSRGPIAVGSVEPVRSELAASLRTVPIPPIPEPVRSVVPTVRVEIQANLRPKLILPPSGSSPLQAESARMEEPLIPPGSTMEGSPAAVIALSTMAPRPGEIVQIPPGSLVVIGDDAPVPPPAALLKPRPAQNALPESAHRRPEPPQTKPTPVPAATPAPTPVHVARQAPATAAPSIPPSPASTSPAAVSIPGTVNAAAPVQAASTRSIRSASGDIRLQTAADGSISLSYPANGQFDVVVVESALPDELARLGQGLSGRPVHTVYLNVGSNPEWVLQYCLPAESSTPSGQNGMVVTLDAPAPLKAPYVLEASLPVESAWRTAGFQVFHGLLNMRGKLERLRAVQAGPSAALLLTALANWTFRPASSAGVPKLVEVLLVIPPTSR